MEFISRLIVAFLSLFFGDDPFSLDDDFQVQEEEVVPNSPQTPDDSLQIPGPTTPENRKWSPPVPRAPVRPRRLEFFPDLDVTARNSLYKAPAQVPLKRMGIRV
jgi:hypothetical protein